MKGIAQGLDSILLSSLSVFYFNFLSTLQEIGTKIKQYLNVKSLNREPVLYFALAWGCL